MRIASPPSLGVRVKLGFGPLDGGRSQAQGVLGGNRPGIAESVTNRRCIRRKTISLGESSGRLEPRVLTKLHEKSEIMSEGKLLISTGKILTCKGEKIAGQVRRGAHQVRTRPCERAAW